VVKARIESSLADVARVVPVASGKGGVGKSAVAVGLAAAVARRGARVGLLDADLQGPSVAKMLGLRGSPVRIGGEDQLLPVAGPLGLAVQSLDFFLEGNQAPDWDGPAAEGATLRSAMEEAALADLLGRTAWGRLDWLIVDLPPGADRLPALARWLPRETTAALMVTIPSEVSLLAVERAVRRAQAAALPLVGFVENLGSVHCAKCGESTPLHPGPGSTRLAAELGLERVLRIPFDPALARAADAGTLGAAHQDPESPALRALDQLAAQLEEGHREALESDRW
jgi:ATP-binding protein involved in chromosome partitioning